MNKLISVAWFAMRVVTDDPPQWNLAPGHTLFMTGPLLFIVDGSAIILAFCHQDDIFTLIADSTPNILQDRLKEHNNCETAPWPPKCAT